MIDMVVECLFLLNPQFLLLEESTLKHIVKCFGSNKDVPVLSSVFYRPPSSNATILEEFSGNHSLFYVETKKCIKNTTSYLHYLHDLVKNDILGPKGVGKNFSHPFWCIIQGQTQDFLKGGLNQECI